MATSADVTSRRRSPIEPVTAAMDAASGPCVRLAPIGRRSYLNLRGRATDPAFGASIGEAFGVAPPDEPCRAHRDGERAALWLGPDEWLLIAPDGEAGAIEAALRSALPSDPWLSVVDLSDANVGLRLEGPESRTVLAKGCRLDLHPAVFTPATCAQTLLGKAQVVLYRPAEDEIYEILLRNSFVRYAVSWLIDAMQAFALQR